MAPQLKRTQAAHLKFIEVCNGARTSHWIFPENSSCLCEVQKTHNPTAFKDVPQDKNSLIPPYHWHWYQDEHFEIQSGRYIFNVEGVETVKDASSGRITIPATLRHTFRIDPTSSEPCMIHILTPPVKNGAGEKFFRNIYNYLDDCEKQGISPSVPQLLLFLDDAEMSLAFPGPAPLMRLLSWGMGVVVGRWFGGYVLGLKASYEEYYDEKTVKKA